MEIIISGMERGNVKCGMLFFFAEMNLRRPGLSVGRLNSSAYLLLFLSFGIGSSIAQIGNGDWPE